MSITRRQPLKRTARLSPVSAKRKAAMAEYAKLRLAFLLANPLCGVWLKINGWSGPAEVTGIYRTIDGRFRFAFASQLIEVGAWESSEVHHKVGRHGKNYLDVSTWLATSKQGHEWLHRHPSEARRLGLLK